MPALRKKGWLSRSHKLQLEIDRSVIKHEIPREVASLGVAELTETRRCVEIEWVAWLMPDAQKCTFKIVCCGTWHYGVLHKWVLCDRWKDDCIWRSANLKKKKFNLFCLTQHSGWSEILCQVYIYIMIVSAGVKGLNLSEIKIIKPKLLLSVVHWDSLELQ